jgi:Ca-activated chloride channel family protein
MTSETRNHFESSSSEERDALLTCYALGELAGAERDFVERLLADPAAADARRVVAETRAVGAALRAARTEESPPRSAALRRAVVATLAAGAGPVQPPPRARARRLSGWLALAGSLAAAVLVAVAVVPPARLARDLARRGAEDRAVATSVAPTPSAAPAGAPARSFARTGLATADLETENLSTLEAVGSVGVGFGGRAEVREREARRGGVDDRRADRERYGRFEEHRFLAVADRPLSTFSIDVDTASYAIVRRFLASGRLPPADAVRIEEFVNYFPYAYPQPAGDEPFAVALEAADCPWREGHRLVRIGIAGRDIDRRARPAGNLVFLIDVSGSMDEPDKLPLVKQALAMLVGELTENDRVSIVTYAGDAGLKLPPTSGDQKRKILDVIEGLSAGGSTHGSAGITLAYEQARETFVPGGANRVILCTDGDLNVGVTSDAALVDLITAQARGGTFLTVLGFGRGNLQDEKLEKLADKGNGVYAYVDGVREARKVLVEQLTGSTITIAKDVKIQVEFNPAQVASYRLVGYENRKLADADFKDDTRDAGEIGAGHTVTMLYEIVPAGGAAAADGPTRGAEPLRYAAEAPRGAAPVPAAGPASRELLTVKLRFKPPEGSASVLREFPLVDGGIAFADASTDTRFAAAVAAFGMLLRESEFKGDATFATVARVAGAALGPDPGGYRAEFLDLVRRAESLANEPEQPAAAGR